MWSMWCKFWQKVQPWWSHEVNDFIANITIKTRIVCNLFLGFIEVRGHTFVIFVGRGFQCNLVSQPTRDSHIQLTKNLGFVISVKEGKRGNFLLKEKLKKFSSGLWVKVSGNSIEESIQERSLGSVIPAEKVSHRNKIWLIINEFTVTSWSTTVTLVDNSSSGNFN